ncbi:hypothetical protein LAZ67_7001514 [Cordylochernes scorpioides]|uniref:Polyprotein n=1 Tax=Cordylochernes scorpioides TaxID=51811 RepID=A0ABY6KMD6_9ARAC|nr:hypothetical protein LAZ67_7001514 [Cordylochernes scorpioides]
MDVNVDLDDTIDGLEENLPYRELIRGLSFFAQRTRPDLEYAAGRLAQYCNKFTKKHWNAAKKVLRYLGGTKDYGITYRPTGEQLKAFSDADWASNVEDRKSTSGYVIMLAGAPIICEECGTLLKHSVQWKQIISEKKTFLERNIKIDSQVYQDVILRDSMLPWTRHHIAGRNFVIQKT